MSSNPEQKPCIGGDPTCPCNDGDACHYEGENPMPIPEQSSGKGAEAWTSAAEKVIEAEYKFVERKDTMWYWTGNSRMSGYVAYSTREQAFESAKRDYLARHIAEAKDKSTASEPVLSESEQRLMDLIRHQRHGLFDAELISADEYAALVQDSQRGERVARLESYDKAHRNERALREALQAKYAALAERQNTALKWCRERLRNSGYSEESIGIVGRVIAAYREMGLEK